MKRSLLSCVLAALALTGPSGVEAKGPGSTSRPSPPPPPPPPPAYRPPPPPPPPSYKPPPPPSYKPPPPPSYKPPAPSYKPPTWQPPRPAATTTPRAQSGSSSAARSSTLPLKSARSGGSGSGSGSGGSRPPLRVVRNPNPPATPTARPKPAPIPAAVKAEHARQRSAFREDVRRTLIRDPQHPLKFLIKDGKWTSDRYHAGRVAHLRSGAAERIGVELPNLNTRTGAKYERRGLGEVRKFVDVKGIPVERKTADHWVKTGKLKASDIRGPHPGWVPKK